MSMQNQNVKVYKASQVLKNRIGLVRVDDMTKQRCQQVIEDNTQDFKPMAQVFLDRLMKAVTHASDGTVDMAKRKAAVTEPIMELKANAKMFKFDLVGDLANIMLSFVEAISRLDSDAVSILSAHQRTLSAIVTKGLRGDGGAVGHEMVKELRAVCERYFKKRALN